ncbi:ABC-type nickel/cobalt efflux system permease component RcnA [Palleronia aestuarii]|uniref:Nickel/cobalt efflux system n=1 Tax=Palleronia aestuarii TaxID=568105 RepID=A0A2W7P0N5_9RHOB|nr:hypothetical protein [Palleronia aestuarii]PZX17012.1 ABC-type nickel/cobalt efflux system permease component RcnA [Palleronia aestuarii]
MRRAVLILPILVVGAFLWAMVSGLDGSVAAWAAGWQREFQNALAGALRGLRAGEPGALWLMTGLCFAYGVAHAAGPGHGKMLIGGYGLGRTVPVLRLSAIAMAAAIGQALTALALVGGCIFVLGWTRVQTTGLAEGLMARASALAIGSIGVWLVLRGLLRLHRGRAARPVHHDHAHDDHAGCGHRHGPTPEEVRAATGPGEILALVGAIAIRPCSGALILLVLSWHMGILAAGVAGTFAMSLGTGAVTVGVAAMAVVAREGTALSFGQAGRATALMPLLEIGAGTGIALLALRGIQLA